MSLVTDWFPETAKRFLLPGPAGVLELATAIANANAPARRGSAIVCHPHSLFGGSMDNKVVTSAERALRRLLAEHATYVHVEPGLFQRPTTAADFYDAATLGGARALGRDDLGRLAPGAELMAMARSASFSASRMKATRPLPRIVAPATPGTAP